MLRRSNKPRRELSLLIGALVFSSASSASLLEEVVVTAQKREQAIQDVGMAIQAFTGDQLQKLHITETADLDNQIPGLVIANAMGNESLTIMNVRGVTQTDIGDHNEGPVAVYVDGSYVSFLGGVGMSMFDIERVEVLKGPQGTLFGRNATGGLIHLISKRPTDELEGFGQITFGEYNLLRTEAALSGPLSDKVSGRITFSSAGIPADLRCRR